MVKKIALKTLLISFGFAFQCSTQTGAGNDSLKETIKNNLPSIIAVTAGLGAVGLGLWLKQRDSKSKNKGTGTNGTNQNNLSSTNPLSKNNTTTNPLLTNTNTGGTTNIVTPANTNVTNTNTNPTNPPVTNAVTGGATNIVTPANTGTPLIDPLKNSNPSNPLTGTGVKTDDEKAAPEYLEEFKKHMKDSIDKITLGQDLSDEIIQPELSSFAKDKIKFMIEYLDPMILENAKNELFDYQSDKISNLEKTSTTNTKKENKSNEETIQPVIKEASSTDLEEMISSAIIKNILREKIKSNKSIQDVTIDNIFNDTTVGEKYITLTTDFFTKYPEKFEAIKNKIILDIESKKATASTVPPADNTGDPSDRAANPGSALDPASGGLTAAAGNLTADTDIKPSDQNSADNIGGPSDSAKDATADSSGLGGPTKISIDDKNELPRD